MLRRIAFIGLVLFALASCVQSPVDQSHDLVLGAIYPLSGPQAPGGKAELAGVQAALKVAQTNLRLQVIDATTPDPASPAPTKLLHAYPLPPLLAPSATTLPPPH